MCSLVLGGSDKWHSVTVRWGSVNSYIRPFNHKRAHTHTHEHCFEVYYGLMVYILGICVVVCTFFFPGVSLSCVYFVFFGVFDVFPLVCFVLSVPVLPVAWKYFSLRWHIMCWVGSKTVTHSLKNRDVNETLWSSPRPRQDQEVPTFHSDSLRSRQDQWDRYVWKIRLEAETTCPEYANLIWLVEINLTVLAVCFA